MVALGDAADIRLGYTFRKGISSGGEGALPVVQPSNVTEFGTIDFADLSRASEEPVRSPQYLEGGDVLLTNRGRFVAVVFGGNRETGTDRDKQGRAGTGKDKAGALASAEAVSVGLCRSLLVPVFSSGFSVVASSGFFVIRLRVVDLLPDYVALYLNSPTGQQNLLAMTVTSTITSLTLAELRQMRIPQVSLDEQRRLSELVALQQRERYLLARTQQLRTLQINSFIDRIVNGSQYD